MQGCKGGIEGVHWGGGWGGGGGFMPSIISKLLVLGTTLACSLWLIIANRLKHHTLWTHACKNSTIAV